MVDITPPNLVADFLLVECRERGEVLTNLKLQKLLYYADGWYSIDRVGGRPLFDEVFQAWVHGPVLPSQYRRFREFKWRPIDVDLDKPADLPERVTMHLSEVIDVFGAETAVSLELMTHRELPWVEARRNLPADTPSVEAISKQTMKTYFQSIDQNEDAEA